MARPLNPVSRASATTNVIVLLRIGHLLYPLPYKAITTISSHGFDVTLPRGGIAVKAWWTNLMPHGAIIADIAVETIDKECKTIPARTPGVPWRYPDGCRAA